MSRIKEKWNEALALRSDSTRRNYRTYFKRFLDKTGLTPEELYHMHLESTRSEDPLDQDVVATKVKRVMKDMEREGYKSGTTRTIYKSVRLFLKSCNLPFELDRYEKGRVVNEEIDNIKTEQIRTLYDCVSAEMRERNRALMMYGKDSGIRVSDMVATDVEDYLNAQEINHPEYGRFKVLETMATKKTGDYAYIHIGEEAINAIDAYLALDGRQSGPLFLARPVPIIDETAEETVKARRWHHKRKVVGYLPAERLRAKTASQMFLRLKENLKGHGKISIHSLRKYHNTCLEGAGMNTNWIKRLQGKSAYEYSHPEGMTLTETYMKAYGSLKVFEDYRKIPLEQIEEHVNRILAARGLLSPVEMDVDVRRMEEKAARARTPSP